jgi:uncharacterized repeat protein (TIGR03803 family)
MRRKRFFVRIRTTSAIFSVALVVASAWAAPKEKLVHNFNSGKGGHAPLAGLIFDAAGHLYGTTVDGGAHNVGTVFELTSKADGNWTEKVLHNFNQNAKDGYYVHGASLIFDSSGNLYGTTVFGGTGTACSAMGCGTVFELTPNHGGQWTEKVLHSFNKGGDGAYPVAGLIFDSSGNLYGTTSQGGTCDCGVVFELTPNGEGRWSEKILHSFKGVGKDGAYPAGGLIFDSSDNLYGTTFGSRAQGNGTVFELMPEADGGWREKVLHNFDGRDGSGPQGSLVFDAAGNLYGTTFTGGTHGSGAVFELTPNPGGSWTEKVLHNFNPAVADGINPEGSLIFDRSGNLYGTTNGGGAHGDYGTVFELTSNPGGGWTEKLLHNFNSNCRDGCTPYSGLTFDSVGNLYGTTANGGAYGGGTVFKITP